MSLVDAVLAAIAVGVAAVATRTDLDRRVVPNRLTAAGALAALAAGTVLDPAGELGRVAWGVAAGAFLGLAALANPEGMGMGDAKLAAVIGLCLGALVVAALLVACALGLSYGGWILARDGLRAARAATLPFAPCLAAGAAAGATIPLL
jgi:leader peptidase (prepilin peptidase)/N-methyltransferase